MIAIAILLLAAAVGFGLARAIGVPALPLLLLVGAAMAPLGILPDPEVLQDALVLGLTFLVFAAGIELNPRRVGAQRRTVLQVGVAQFAALGLTGLLLAILLGFDLRSALYLGIALSASSTLVVVRVLQQRGQLFEPFGRLVIGVLLLQDLLVIVLMPVVMRSAEGWLPVLAGIAGVGVLMALAWASVRWVAPVIARRFGQDEETLLLVVLAALFLFLGLSTVLGLPVVAGAFLAGVALSRFPLHLLLRGQLSSLTDFFLAIFFTALGALVVVPSLMAVLHALVFAAAVLTITPIVVTIVAERAGLSARSSLESGLLLSQTSEFSLIVALQGLTLGHLTPEVFGTVALVTALTMLVTPLFATDRMTWRLMRLHPMRRRATRMSVPSGHIVLLGCGDNGMPLLETLIAAGHHVVVVDDDPAVISRLEEGEVSAIRGDGSDFHVLRQAGAPDARIVISTMRRARDSENVLKFLPDVPVLVRVFDDASGERIRALGGRPVLYSAAAADDFSRWLDQAESYGLERERRTRPRSE
jgi:Kef-type K+ transport system membrane component KefB